MGKLFFPKDPLPNSNHSSFLADGISNSRNFPSFIHMVINQCYLLDEAQKIFTSSSVESD